MKISMLSATLFLASLLLTSLSAQDNEEKLNCTALYDVCVIKCEALDNGFIQCLEKCDEEYEKCSEQEEKAAE